MRELLKPISIIGLIIGLIEIAIAVVSIKGAKDRMSKWLKTFGVGVLMLGIAQITCKFVGHGLLGLGLEYSIGVPLKAIGLSLVIYSILKAIDFEYINVMKVVVAALAGYFLLGSGYSLHVLQKYQNVVLFSVPHLAFLTVLPWMVSALLFYIYKEMRDPGALAFGVGLFLYGLATLIIIYLLEQGYPMFEAMTFGLGFRALGLAIMLAGFFVA